MFRRSEAKDLLLVIVLGAIGFGFAIKQPLIFTVIIGLAVLSALASFPFLLSERRDSEKAWLHLRHGYALPIVLPPTSQSLATGTRIDFATAYQQPLLLPEAGIFLNQETDALRLVSYDHQHDIVLPIEMIEKVEFDAGDGPIGRRHGKTSVRKRLLGRYYTPTVFLGVPCGADREIVVYPLVFHPEMEDEARALYQRLQTKLSGVLTTVTCPLSAAEFDNMMPPNVDAPSLPRWVLLRFWPDYKGGRVSEWFSR